MIYCYPKESISVLFFKYNNMLKMLHSFNKNKTKRRKGMNFHVRHYSEIDKEKWNTFVRSSSMGWAYFLYDMIKFHRHISYKNESFAIVDENKEIFMVIQLHRTPQNKLVSQWGFVVKDNLTKKQSKHLKEIFKNYIDSYMSKFKIKSFDLNICPLSAINLPENHNMVNPSIYYFFSPGLRYTYLVDLAKSDDRMLADCEETTRQAIRKYDKLARYTVVESDGSLADCNKYIELHKETYTRTNAKKNIIDDSYNKNIFETLIPQKISKVFFLKDNETNEYIATVAILIYGKTAYYWWGASKDDKEVGVNKYLLFKVICYVREMFGKCGYFETGGAYPHKRVGKYKGLNDFKKCFGTFLHPIFKGSYEKLSDIKTHEQLKLLGFKINLKTSSKVLKIIKTLNKNM